MQELTLSDFKMLLGLMAEVVIANEVPFCELDSVAGDGDFGMSIAKGFRAVKQEEALFPADDIGAYLKAASMIILEHCGGASGPIWGSAFSGAARAARGKTVVSLSEFADMTEAAVAAVQKKGGAKKGDKTLLDALIPAAESLRASAAAGRDIPTALSDAAQAAREGAEATKAMIASRGRASYVGARSLEHPDAGAFALGVIFTQIAESLQKG